MANYGKYYIAVRLLLLKQYLEANAGRSRIVKRRELEQLLEEHDMKVEKKTLYADFAALGDICGLQLDYDPHKKGYRLLNPPFEPYELRLLVDSVQSSKFITREKAREITAKLKKFAGKDTVESLNRENHVANRVRSMNDSVVKDADRIHSAIAQNRKISFRYFHYTPNKDNPKRYSKSGDVYVVSPYALLWDNGNYYLYAYNGKQFRYYRVDRMKHMEITEEERERVFFLFKYSDTEMQTSGENFFGQFWAEAAGAVNVAEEIKTDNQVSVNMEQIYAWNPSTIFISNFTASQPEDLYTNAVGNYDWSAIQAVQEEKVFKMPLGMYRSYTPGVDTPVTLLWFAKTTYPELFEDVDIVQETKNYYKEVFGVELTDAQAASIFAPDAQAGLGF